MNDVNPSLPLSQAHQHDAVSPGASLVGDLELVITLCKVPPSPSPLNVPVIGAEPVFVKISKVPPTRGSKRRGDPHGQLQRMPFVVAIISRGFSVPARSVLEL
jgi:hypothetical protein